MIPRIAAAITVVAGLFVVGPAVEALSGPPSGRPPVNALSRYQPRLYDVSFEVTLMPTAPIANLADRHLFRVKDAPIVMPIIYQGAYSKVFPGSEEGRVLLDNRAAENIARATDENRPFHTHHLRMVIPEFVGQSIRWRVGFRTQSWSAAVDERLAQQATWPREMKWPEEVADGLKPQAFIESDHPYFRAVIEQNFGDRLHAMTPYLAAKHIVAYCLNAFQVSQQSTPMGGTMGAPGARTIQGLNVNGALASATQLTVGDRAGGSRHDLVCLCVAMLRAAQIPARPVIGIERDRLQGRTDFVSWAEFYLPGSGWVSFDPAAMLSKGPGQYRNFSAAWPEFGTMKDLNERIPLSYHFIPPAGVEAPGYPSIWGWDPRQRQPSYEQVIQLQITNRGRGEEDPT